MRAYPGVDLNGLPSSKERFALQTMDTWIKDAQKAIGSAMSTVVASGGAPVGANYVVTSADPTLTAEKVLVTQAPLSGAVGAGTVTIGAPTVIVGPASMLDTEIFIADGTTGKLAKASGVVIGSTPNDPRDSAGGWITALGVASKTSQTSITNSATGEQTLFSATLPSGMLASVGRNLRLRAYGSWSNTTSAGSYNLRLKYGSTSVWETGALTPTGGSYTDDWMFDADVVTSGANATRAGGHFYDANSGILTLFMPSSLAVARTPTTSGSVTVSLVANFSGSADSKLTITCEIGQIELGGLI